MKNPVLKGRYVRCSTDSQNPIRQLQKLHPDEKLYIDFASGSLPLNKRPEGSKMLEDVERGLINYISIESVDRLGRSTTSVINQLQYFLDKGVTVKVENLGLESILPDGKPNDIFTLICTVLANISTIELATMTERRNAGIKAAKERNEVYKGRTKGTFDSPEVTLKKHGKIVKLVKKYPESSLREIAKLAKDDKTNKVPSPHTVKKIKELLDKTISVQ